MQIRYYKEYSRFLNRFMEFKVYGHAGRPIVIFPCQSGRFFDRDAHQQAAGCLRIEKDFLQGIVIDLEVHIVFQVIPVTLPAGCDQEFLGSLIGSAQARQAIGVDRR